LFVQLTEASVSFLSFFLPVLELRIYLSFQRGMGCLKIKLLVPETVHSVV